MRFRLALTALLLAAITMPAFAADFHPTILPVDKVPFNWPPPARIGEANYFKIAIDGKPRCAIILPERPAPAERLAAESLQTYLRVVTGGDFEIKNEPADGPGIYIGATERAKSFRSICRTSSIRYSLPNIGGFVVQTVDPRDAADSWRGPNGTLLRRGHFPAQVRSWRPALLADRAWRLR